jgi:hypothetical protein
MERKVEKTDVPPDWTPEPGISIKFDLRMPQDEPLRTRVGYPLSELPGVAGRRRQAGASL